MPEPLTGYEASSVAEIEAILDASPADSDTVYQQTVGYSERALAAVAAKRAGSGGASMILRDRYTDQVHVLVPNDGSPTLMSWGASSGPDLLFDLTDPTQPVALESGVYAITVNADAVDALSADVVFILGLDVDIEGDTAEVAVISAAATSFVSRPRAALSMTYYVPAGHSVRVFVTNIDPGGDKNFKIEDVVVQRLS
jgi:hypothetical protein